MDHNRKFKCYGPAINTPFYSANALKYRLQRIYQVGIVATTFGSAVTSSFFHYKWGKVRDSSKTFGNDFLNAFMGIIPGTIVGFGLGLLWPAAVPIGTIVFIDRELNKEKYK